MESRQGNKIGEFMFDNLEGTSHELDDELYARHTEIENFKDLEKTRGTSIPALFNIFYKFIQNPSTVSVETFKRMVDTDETIGAGVDLLTTVLASRLGTYQHENDEVTEWMNKALSLIDGGFYQAVKELLSASWAGFSVQEATWANHEHGYIVERLMTLPPATVLFEVDRIGKLTSDGILQYQRNYNPALLGGGGLFGTGFTGAFWGFDGKPDPLAKLGDLAYPIRVANTFNYLSIRIPKQKCIHFAFDAQGRFGNPYGRSLLRRAYSLWVMKCAFLQMLSIALDRKGTPLTVVFSDPNSTVLNPSKYVPGQNPKGQAGFGERADLAAVKAFKEIHNDSVIFLPGMKGKQFEVESLQVNADAGVFLGAIQMCNQGMLRALSIPSLLFNTGDGSGSWALGQEHAKTFDKTLDGMLLSLKQCLLDQLIKPLLQFNFPEEVWKHQGVGDFTKKDLGTDELDKILESYGKLQDMGVIDVSDLQDLNKIREMAGFAVREDVPESAMKHQDKSLGGEEEWTGKKPSEETTSA